MRVDDYNKAGFSERIGVLIHRHSQAACTRPAQGHISLTYSVDVGRAHEVLPFVEELLTIDDYWSGCVEEVSFLQG